MVMAGELVVTGTDASSLERLETRLRVVEWALGILLLLVIAVGAWSLTRREKAPEGVVGVDSIRLVDGEGKLRASVNADAEGTRLRIYDGQENRRISLAVDAEGSPGIALFDGAGNLRAELSVQEKGGGFALLDENGRKLFSRP
jgi:hypothetical protein